MSHAWRCLHPWREATAAFGILRPQAESTPTEFPRHAQPEQVLGSEATLSRVLHFDRGDDLFLSLDDDRRFGSELLAAPLMFG